MMTPFSFVSSCGINHSSEVNTMKQTLWTRNFTRITAATTLALPAASSVNSPCPFWSLTRQAALWPRRWWWPFS